MFQVIWKPTNGTTYKYWSKKLTQQNRFIWVDAFTSQSNPKNILAQCWITHIAANVQGVVAKLCYIFEANMASILVNVSKCRCQIFPCNALNKNCTLHKCSCGAASYFAHLRWYDFILSHAYWQIKHNQLNTVSKSEKTSCVVFNKRYFV